MNYVVVQSWDGDLFKNIEKVYEMDGEPTTRRRNSGVVSDKPPTLKDDLFAALLMRMNGYNYLRWLTVDRAKLFGTALIDGQNTSIVRVGHMEDTLCRQYYLDLNRGGIPLKAEVYVKGELNKMVKNVVIKEVKRGLYLPVEGEAYYHTHHNGKEKAVGYRIEPDSIKVNQGLKKADFQVEFEPDLPIWDHTIGMGRQHGINSDPIEPIAMETLERLLNDATVAHAEAGEKSSPKELATNSEPVVKALEKKEIPRLNSTVAVGDTRRSLYLIVSIAVVFFIGVFAWVLIAKLSSVR